MLEVLFVPWPIGNVILFVGTIGIVLHAKAVLKDDFDKRWSALHDDVTVPEYSPVVRYVFGITFWGAWLATSLLYRFLPTGGKL